MRTNEENEKKYGSVNFKGVKYILTNDACMDNYGTDGAVRYYASGINPITGDQVQIAWDTSEYWDELGTDCSEYETIAQCINNHQYDGEAELSQLESKLAEIEAKYDGNPPVRANDEYDACDWDNPVSVEIID